MCVCVCVPGHGPTAGQVPKVDQTSKQPQQRHEEHPLFMQLQGLRATAGVGGGGGADMMDDEKGRWEWTGHLLPCARVPIP
jgi:hypothetical protein